MRRSMRIVETAWLAQPHPDLADAYAHVKLGDSARQRLVRVETLAAKAPGHIEGALAIARAAIDAAEFAKAREALAPFIAAPTQRVALLMAEIERTEHGDSGRARAWTLRAVRALHDPAWTADGYVSDRWRPVSPVTGRLDAFQWQTPVAALAVRHGPPRSNPRRSRRPCWRRRAARSCSSRRRTDRSRRRARGSRRTGRAARRGRTMCRRPDCAPTCCRRAEPAASSPPRSTRYRRRRRSRPSRPNQRRASRPPCSAPRQDIPKAVPAPIPAVIPIIRAPDDPGIDDDGPAGRIRGTNRPAQGPGRRLARIFVALGRRVIRTFFLPTGAMPDIRCGRFGSLPTTRCGRWRDQAVRRKTLNWNRCVESQGVECSSACECISSNPSPSSAERLFESYRRTARPLHFSGPSSANVPMMT